MLIKSSYRCTPILDRQGAELTEKEQSYFDWTHPDDLFFRHQRQLYCMRQFVRCKLAKAGEGLAAHDPTAYWHGAHNTSMTTGALVHLHDDDYVIVGSYRS